MRHLLREKVFACYDFMCLHLEIYHRFGIHLHRIPGYENMYPVGKDRILVNVALPIPCATSGNAYATAKSKDCSLAQGSYLSEAVQSYFLFQFLVI